MADENKNKNNPSENGLTATITNMVDGSKPQDTNSSEYNKNNGKHPDGKDKTKKVNKHKWVHKNKNKNKNGYDAHNKHDGNNRSGRDERDNRDYEHLNYGPKKEEVTTQTLDLKIFEGADVRANGLYPLVGKSLKKKDVDVDWYTEVKATANGALNHMASNFMEADHDWGLLESDALDYIIVQINHNTYAQLPFPGWIYTNQLPNNFNPVQPWPGYGDEHYQSYTTRRCVELGKQLNTIAVTLQTNQSFANMPALNYVMCPYTTAAHNTDPVATIINNNYQQDQNPFWRLYYNNGLLGWIDGVNTFMLTAVTHLYNFKRQKVLLEYFIKKHYVLAPYLKLALGLYEMKPFIAAIKSIEQELSYIYCDVAWVQREAKASLMISKTTDTLWSPLLITQPQMFNPTYSMVANGGTGIAFTIAYGNGALDGRANPYYVNNQSIAVDNMAITLLQDLQNVIFQNDGQQNGNALNQIVTNFRQLLLNAAGNVLAQVQMLKTQLTGYNALMSQSVAGGFIYYAKHAWKMEEYDGEIAYVPQLAIPLQHPEAAITSATNLSGQFSASIALERSRIEEALVDSTRYYAIAGEWFFSMQCNNYDNDVPQYMHYLQYTDLDFEQEDGLVGVTLAPMNADNTLTDVFQLPEIIIYSWMNVYLMNTGYFRFRLWSNFHRPLNAGVGYTVFGDNAGIVAYEQLTWTGTWMLSNGTFISVGANNVYNRRQFVLASGMGAPNAVVINQYWTSSFNNLVDVFGCMSTSSQLYDIITNDENFDDDAFFQNMVDAVITRSVYTVCVPVTMRNTLSEMIDSTIAHSAIASPLEKDAVAKFTQVTAK